MADLGEIVRGEAERYLKSRPFTSGEQLRAMRDIARCRTEAMGSVSVACEQCPVEYRLFRSCRNRSCPLCQGEARASWLAARKAEILPVKYLQVGFNAPAEINELAPYCPKVFYDAVIHAAGQAVIDVGRSVLRARLGSEVQLHTWSRTMARHIHAHSIVPCGGFSEDGSRWISFEPGQLPVEALDTRFRTLLCRKLRAAAQKGKLELPADAKVAYVTQTTLSVADAQRILDAIKRRWPGIKGPPKEDICYATTNRQRAVSTLSPEVELVIVIGSKNSSNSKRLVETAKEGGRPGYLIDDVSELRGEWFEGVKGVLVTAGVSAPEHLVRGVIERMEREFGGVVEVRTLVEEDVAFELPRSLRSLAVIS